MDVGETIEHRPMQDILTDLTDAQIAREKADNTLNEVLAQLKLNRNKSS